MSPILRHAHVYHGSLVAHQIVVPNVLAIPSVPAIWHASIRNARIHVQQMFVVKMPNAECWTIPHNVFVCQISLAIHLCVAAGLNWPIYPPAHASLVHAECMLFAVNKTGPVHVNANQVISVIPMRDVVLNVFWTLIACRIEPASIANARIHALAHVAKMLSVKLWTICQIVNACAAM